MVNTAGTDCIDCRLCGKSAEFSFIQTATDGDEVKCYKCSSCLSLQTEVPYWINDCYADTSGADTDQLPDQDTWAAERTGFCCVAVYFIWKLAGLSEVKDKLLDWGGGPGLLVRMLRDIGIDAYNDDKYIKNHFASGFGRADNDRYNFITAFEVFEHFTNPKSDLELIFALQPSLLLMSTGIYTDQGPEWPYLGGAKSQHVFFYSEKALEHIGNQYNYHVVRLPKQMRLFVRQPISKVRLGIIRYILGRTHLAEILFALPRKKSLASQDNQMIRKMLNNA